MGTTTAASGAWVTSQQRPGRLACSHCMGVRQHGRHFGTTSVGRAVTAPPLWRWLAWTVMSQRRRVT
jgi:hypothetical protein